MLNHLGVVRVLLLGYSSKPYSSCQLLLNSVGHVSSVASRQQTEYLRLVAFPLTGTLHIQLYGLAPNIGSSCL